MGALSAHQIIRRPPPATELRGDDRADGHGPAPADDLPSEFTRVAGTAERTPQAPITNQALRAGLEALGRALARRHPGRRFVFEAAPRDNRAGLIKRGEIIGQLAAPEDPDAALVDGHRLRSTRPA